MVRVHIPSPLRSYTGNATWVYAEGATIDEVLADLNRQFPGIRFRAVDEQGRIRRHMRLFLNDEVVNSLSLPLTDGDIVTLMQALSGG